MTPQERAWITAVTRNPEKLRRKMRTHRMLIGALAILTAGWIGLFAFGRWSNGLSIAIGLALVSQLVSNSWMLYESARLLKTAEQLACEEQQ